MEEIKIPFTHKTVSVLFDKKLLESIEETEASSICLLVDKNVYELHKNLFSSYDPIIIKSGEEFKVQATVDKVIDEMLERGYDRKTVLFAIGGGVTTDIGGYVASVYKRGIRFNQVPTSILAMVDAAIGGKNGVNTALYKNMVGTIYQPNQIIIDFSFLKTLPKEEWINGFAEIIKHSCIWDREMFNELSENNIDNFLNDETLTKKIIRKNISIKAAIVCSDELETGNRMLLNFGHTLGHALEKEYDLKHGFAISLGMVAAARISEEINNFYSDEKDLLLNLLEKYSLPVKLNFDKEAIWNGLLSDKKRNGETMNFVLLDSIGKAVVKPIGLTQLKDLIAQVL
jgi:3-dehydroquinate synthase